MIKRKFKITIFVSIITIVISMSLAYALISSEFSVGGKLYILSNVATRFTKIENVDENVETKSTFGVNSIFIQDAIASESSVSYNINFQNNDSKKIIITDIVVTDEDSNSIKLNRLSELYSDLSIEITSLNVGNIINENTSNNLINLEISNNGQFDFEKTLKIDFLWESYIPNVDDEVIISDVITDNPENEYSLAGTVLTTKTYLSTVDSNSSASYTISLTNNVDYTLAFNNIIEQLHDNQNISYNIVGINPGDLLTPGASKTITITFQYKSGNITSNVANSIIKFDFIPVYQISYLNISSSIVSSLPTTINEGEDLSIVINNPYNSIFLLIYQNQNLLDETMYTYTNGNLNIPNVSGNLVIEAQSIVTPVVDPNTGYTFTGSTSIPANGTVLENGWTGNTYFLTFDIPNVNGGNNSYTYSIPIKNETNKTWSNITSTSSIVTNSSNNLRQFTSTLSSTSVAPNGTLTINYNIRFKSSNTNNSATGKSVITLMVDGIEQTLEVYIEFR